MDHFMTYAQAEEATSEEDVLREMHEHEQRSLSEILAEMDADPDEAYERHLERREDWEAEREDHHEREMAGACGR